MSDASWRLIGEGPFYLVTTLEPEDEGVVLYDIDSAIEEAKAEAKDLGVTVYILRSLYEVNPGEPTVELMLEKPISPEKAAAFVDFRSAHDQFTESPLDDDLPF